MRDTIIRNCKHCGKLINQKPSNKSPDKRTYCNKQCIIAGRMADAARRNKAKCQQCGKDFTRKTKCINLFFCSSSCQHESRYRDTSVDCFVCSCKFTPIRMHLGRYIKSLKKTEHTCSHDCLKAKRRKDGSKKCNECEVLFTPVRVKDGGYVVYRQLNYCSYECSNSAVKRANINMERPKGPDHPNWNGGTHRCGGRGSMWESIAEKCRELHGRCCAHCGKSEGENGRRLDVNHIKPFHQWLNKINANKQDNLEALCRSCHTKADWKWRKENPVQMILNIFN